MKIYRFKMKLDNTNVSEAMEQAIVPTFLNDYKDVTYDESELSERLIHLISISEDFTQYVREASELGFSDVEIIKNWLSSKKINIVKLV